MDRRQRQALIALAALLVGALIAVLGLRACGDDEDSGRPQMTAAEPLGFVPQDADVTVDVDLSSPLPALLYEQLTAISNLPKRGHAVLALKGGRQYLAIQGGRSTRRASKVKDGVLVVAPTQAALAGMMKADHTGARAAFEARVARMPKSAPVKVAFGPAQLLARLSPKIAESTWGRNQRDGQAALTARGANLVVSFVISGAATSGEDLPVAPGDQDLRRHGRAPLTLTVGDPAQTLRFAKDAGLADVLHVVERLPGFLEPNLKDLGDSATLTTTDLKTVTVRLEPPDPDDWAKKLDRLDALSGLFRTLGLADVRIDRQGDAYAIQEHDRLALRAGVYGDVLVLSTSPTADLKTAARAPGRTVKGPLSASISADLILDRLGVDLPQGVLNVGAVRANASITGTELVGRVVLRVTR